MPEDSLNFGMTGLPNHEDLISLTLETFCRMMHSLDVWARSVDDVETVLSGLALNFGDYPMRPKYEGGAGIIGYLVGNGHSRGLKPSNYLGIMDERTKRADGSVALASQLMNEIERTLNSVACSRVFGNGDGRRHGVLQGVSGYQRPG